MKRMIAVLLAVMLMTGVFTACSGTAYYDDGYGNVSTTPNGRVNGTNERTNNYEGNWGAANNGTGTYNGTNGAYNGTNGMGNANGTGMTGSR